MCATHPIACQNAGLHKTAVRQKTQTQVICLRESQHTSAHELVRMGQSNLSLSLSLSSLSVSLAVPSNRCLGEVCCAFELSAWDCPTCIACTPSSNNAAWLNRHCQYGLFTTPVGWGCRCRCLLFCSALWAPGIWHAVDEPGKPDSNMEPKMHAIQFGPPAQKFEQNVFNTLTGGPTWIASVQPGLGT
jgi:hypothetical protein